MSGSTPTIWILGDQLHRHHGALAGHGPDTCRVLMIESRALLMQRRWHRQRLHVVLSAMRHFADELRHEGFSVDYRVADTLADGLQAHRKEHQPVEVIAATPFSHQGVDRLTALDVTLVPHRFFITDVATVRAWAADRKRFRMEDFYRWQRQHMGILMDGAEPEGGRWNFDADNREPPPRDGRNWPEFTRFDADSIDDAVQADIDSWGVPVWGAGPSGEWPVNRAQAAQRLAEFIDRALPTFGAHEDAMLKAEWKLAHSTLSSSMNLGLLHPEDVARAAESAYASGAVPLNSAEGFIRQVIGWREYVWSVYWLWGPEYRHRNHLNADQRVPPAFTGDATTEMACVASTVAGIEGRAYAHHIERLMVLGNLALTVGVDPQAMTDWMTASFIDGAEWVMVPNVVGMALHADGGMMATKPYASGGAYINKMSDHCRDCRFDPKKRTGENACPFTSLYWDFLARNETALQGNHRLGQQLAGMRRLADLEQTRARAAEVRTSLANGTL